MERFQIQPKGEIPGYNGAMDADTKKTAKPRRRWLRFSLRTLLIVVPVLAVPLGWVGWKKGQERATITWVEEMGGQIGFLFRNDERSWWEESTDKWFGERVWWVDLINTQVTDLSPLAELKNLDWLDLSNTQVSDEQVQELRQALPHCEIHHLIR